MSTTTTEVKVSYLYEDGTTKAYTIPNVDYENLPNVKPRMILLNRAFGGDQTVSSDVATYAANMKRTFVSSDGATLTRIARGQVIETEEEVIYNGD